MPDVVCAVKLGAAVPAWGVVKVSIVIVWGLFDGFMAIAIAEVADSYAGFLPGLGVM